MPVPDRYQEKRQGYQFSCMKAARVSIQPVWGQLPGSPRENGSIESFSDKMQDELWNREVFTTPEEFKVLIEQRRTEYNQVRPRSSLGSDHQLPRLSWLQIRVNKLYH